MNHTDQTNSRWTVLRSGTVSSPPAGTQSVCTHQSGAGLVGLTLIPWGCLLCFCTKAARLQGVGGKVMCRKVSQHTQHAHDSVLQVGLVTDPLLCRCHGHHIVEGAGCCCCAARSDCRNPLLPL
jgi:hypothetical protein